MAILFHQRPTLENINLPIQPVISWLATQTKNVKLGETTVPNTNFTATIIEKNPVNPTMETFEAHKQMADIHYCINGSERILYAPTCLLTSASDYDKENDVVFYDAPKKSSSLLLTSGSVAILFPADAHLPFIPANDEFIKKIIVKVPIDQFDSNAT